MSRRESLPHTVGIACTAVDDPLDCKYWFPPGEGTRIVRLTNKRICGIHLGLAAATPMIPRVPFRAALAHRWGAVRPSSSARYGVTGGRNRRGCHRSDCVGSHRWLASIAVGRNRRMGCVANGVAGALRAVVGGSRLTGCNLYSMPVAFIGAMLLMTLAVSWPGR